ncbi:MAG: hypothetical protein ACT4OP_00005 [Actinomycetota bacterium]
MNTRSRRAIGVAGLILLLMSLLVVLGLPAGAAPSDPPGNNGTVKIDAVEFDIHPDNQPHVGCVFQVDFYGYDLGSGASVLFEVQPPTGPFQPILLDSVAIGGDEAGGGTDLDGARTYDLGPLLGGYEKHPQQGWHVKLTVNATGSIGADVKHKVFWITGCASSPPGGGPPTDPPGGRPPVTGPPSGSQPTSPPGETQVSGIQVTAPPPVAQVSQTTEGPQVLQTELPLTGMSTSSLVVVAFVLAMAGVLCLLASGSQERPISPNRWN